MKRSDCVKDSWNACLNFPNLPMVLKSAIFLLCCGEFSSVWGCCSSLFRSSLVRNFRGTPDLLRLRMCCRSKQNCYFTSNPLPQSKCHQSKELFLFCIVYHTLKSLLRHKKIKYSLLFDKKEEGHISAVDFASFGVSFHREDKTILVDFLL